MITKQLTLFTAPKVVPPRTPLEGTPPAPREAGRDWLKSFIMPELWDRIEVPTPIVRRALECVRATQQPPRKP